MLQSEKGGAEMIIRPAAAADAPAMAEIYAPYVQNTAVSFEEVPPDASELAARMEKLTAQYPWLCAVENGEVIGYAYASPQFSRAAFRWCADLSVYLRPDCRRRGVGSALCRALLTVLTAQGYRSVWAVVTGDNEASLRFHTAIGFERVAELPETGYKLGAWHSVVFLRYVLSPGEPEGEPRPWHELDMPALLREAGV